MAKASADILAQNLVRLLNQQASIQSELIELMNRKLDAIKAADSREIESLTDREMELVAKAEEREGLRRQLMGQILESLGLEKPDRAMRLSELADYFTEPLRSHLIVAAAGLKRKLIEIERGRIVMELLTREILGHVGQVLAVMTQGNLESDCYSRRGTPQQAGSSKVFEAVG